PSRQTDVVMNNLWIDDLVKPDHRLRRREGVVTILVERFHHPVPPRSSCGAARGVENNSTSVVVNRPGRLITHVYICTPLGSCISRDSHHSYPRASCECRAADLAPICLQYQ